MRNRGLSLIELLIAIGILAIALAAFTSIVVSNLHYNTSAGARTQAAGLLDFFGRKVIGGDGGVLPQPDQDDRNWSYGALASSFPDLKQAGGFSNADRYSLAVKNLGTWSDPNNSFVMHRYRLQICWQGSSGQECVQADTLGPEALASGSPPAPLPGIN